MPKAWIKGTPHMPQTTPSGLLVIDKPQGVTSFDAVAAVRGALHIKKVGHAGTLDPMATGALVIAFGHATRLLNAIVAHDKTYEPPFVSACAPPPTMPKARCLSMTKSAPAGWSCRRS